MNKEYWPDVLQSDKPKKKPNEFDNPDELPHHLRGLALGHGPKSHTVKAYGDYLFSADNGRKLYQEEFEAWSKKDNAYRTRFEIQTWAYLQPIDWQVGVTMHFPLSLAQNKSFDAMLERTRILKFQLNKLDRHYFKNQVQRRHEKRVERFVVEEYQKDVGFHIHMALHCTGGIDPIELTSRMERNWQDFWPRNAFRRMARKHIFWSELIEGGFVGYMTKHIGTNRADIVWACQHH